MTVRDAQVFHLEKVADPNLHPGTLVRTHAHTHTHTTHVVLASRTPRSACAYPSLTGFLALSPQPALLVPSGTAWLYFDRGHADYVRADDVEVCLWGWWWCACSGLAVCGCWWWRGGVNDGDLVICVRMTSACVVVVVCVWMT